MSSIQQLLLNSDVTASTYFAGTENGQDYKYPITAIKDYLDPFFSSENETQVQRAAPNANIFTVIVSPSTSNIWVLIAPTGAFSIGAIALPSVSNLYNGQEILVTCTQAVAAFSITIADASAIYGGPGILAANDFFKIRYDQVTNAWYRVG